MTLSEGQRKQIVLGSSRGLLHEVGGGRTPVEDYRERNDSLRLEKSFLPIRTAENHRLRQWTPV